MAKELLESSEEELGEGTIKKILRPRDAENIPFLKVCEKNRLKSVKLLCSLKDMDMHPLKIRDYYGRNGLHMAAKNGAFEVVKFLIEVGSSSMAGDEVSQLLSAKTRGEKRPIDLASNIRVVQVKRSPYVPRAWSDARQKKLTRMKMHIVFMGKIQVLWIGIDLGKSYKCGATRFLPCGMLAISEKCIG